MLEFAHQLLPMYLDEFVTYVPGSSQAGREGPPYGYETGSKQFYPFRSQAAIWAFLRMRSVLAVT